MSAKKRKRKNRQKRQHPKNKHPQVEMSQDETSQEEMIEQKEANAFLEFLKTLTDEQKPLSPHYLLFLDGISPEEAEQLKEIWPRISLRRRRAITEDASASAEENFTANFFELGKIALDDPDPQVRFNAIGILWEEEDKDVVRRILKILTTDPDPEVRALAASSLGGQMFSGSIEALDERLFEEIEDALFRVLENEAEDERVRRSALASLGYTAQRDRIDEAIRQALQSGNDEWVISALRAIGNTMDEEEWGDTVLKYFGHVNPAVRSMAARAAGMMGLVDALPKLLYLLQDANADVRMMAAWALSEIGAGGEKVMAALKNALYNAADEEEKEVIDDAIQNFLFNSNTHSFWLLAFSEEELAEMMHTLDKEELEAEEDIEEDNPLSWLSGDFQWEDDEE